mmetsp:Transcript_21248/g.32684  ORF Transcript_21248/g.32684 Transcript_21248/m.32684 type:complete len:176 (-) Transcript_21248:112-639(-)|eukprot:CAMPEP_0195296804 /NCGR_PEP_ID=MMETSP0707-20130614/20205_1 /TAXON_ID=33640 /ORGANISM="Asterionellopsis glacialis, Strain CCMP134" /LENGTH=175 /DNA_ID=CAMNT_0040358421 /DNA_START=130 /DNA_END=657 /DNA_ORIENTATION=-
MNFLISPKPFMCSVVMALLLASSAQAIASEDLVFSCSSVGRMTSWKFTANEHTGPTSFVADWGSGPNNAFAKLDQGESWTLNHSYAKEGKYKVSLRVGADPNAIDHEHAMCIHVSSEDCDPERPMEECDVDSSNDAYSPNVADLNFDRSSSAKTAMGYTKTLVLGGGAMLIALIS